MNSSSYHRHRQRPVAVLRAAVRLCNDTSWYMSNANGTVGGVHVLAASTASTFGFNTKVCRRDRARAFVPEVWHDLHYSKARVTSLLGIEWGYPDEPVHACLKLQPAECIAPTNFYCGALDPMLSFRNVYFFNLQSSLLCPQSIHAKEHLAPVGAVMASRPCIERQECVGTRSTAAHDTL